MAPCFQPFLEVDDELLVEELVLAVVLDEEPSLVPEDCVPPLPKLTAL